MPRRPMYLPSEVLQRAQESSFEDSLADALDGLSFQRSLPDALGSIRESLFGDRASTTWKPLPIVVSERPDAARIAEQQQRPSSGTPSPMPAGTPTTPETPTTPRTPGTVDATVTTGQQVSGAPMRPGESVGSVQATSGPASSTPTRTGDPSGGVEQWNDLVAEASRSYGVPESIIKGIMHIESGGNPQAVSAAGALGLMQTMPFHYGQGEDGMDPRTNVLRGTKILADNYRRYGDWDRAAAAYFGAIDDQGRITDATDATGTSGSKYVQLFRDAASRYGGVPGAASPTAGASPPAASPPPPVPAVVSPPQQAAGGQEETVTIRNPINGATLTIPRRRWTDFEPGGWQIVPAVSQAQPDPLRMALSQGAGAPTSLKAEAEDEPYDPRDADQGPRESGYTIPSDVPSSVPERTESVPGVSRDIPETPAPADPTVADPNYVGPAPGAPEPPTYTFANGGEPTASARWTGPVDTRPREQPVAAQQDDAVYLDQSFPSPPGWQALVDAAGNVVQWVRERGQQAYDALEPARDALASLDQTGSEAVGNPGEPVAVLPRNPVVRAITSPLPIPDRQARPPYTPEPVSDEEAANRASVAGLQPGQHLITPINPEGAVPARIDAGGADIQQIPALAAESARRTVQTAATDVGEMKRSAQEGRTLDAAWSGVLAGINALGLPYTVAQEVANELVPVGDVAGYQVGAGDIAVAIQAVHDLDALVRAGIQITPQIVRGLKTGAIKAADLIDRGIEAARGAGTRVTEGARALGAEAAGQLMDLTPMSRVVPPGEARQIPGGVRVPESSLLAEAVENTPGARLTQDGLELDVQRSQKPADVGREPSSGGVFYGPDNGRGRSAYTFTEEPGSPSLMYGGPQEVRGPTILRRPFVEGENSRATLERLAVEAGRSPDQADEMVSEFLALGRQGGGIEEIAAGRRPRLDEAAYNALARKWGLPEMPPGEGLPELRVYERLRADLAREAGYDSIVRVMQQKRWVGMRTEPVLDPPKIVEVHDLREATYPTPEGGYTLRPEFQPREPASTTAYGVFGTVPSPQPSRGRPTVEVIREQLARARNNVERSLVAGDQEAAAVARERAAQLEGDLADAINARRALEPAIASDVGRRLEDVPVEPSIPASDVGRERVAPSAAADLSPPSAVATDMTGRANATAGTVPESAPTDRLGAVNRALGQGLASSVSGGVGAQVNQQMNPDDPYAGAKGFAVGALAPPLLARGARGAARRLGRATEAEGALIGLGDVPPSKIRRPTLPGMKPPPTPMGPELRRPISEEPNVPLSIEQAGANQGTRQGALPGMDPLRDASPQPIGELAADLQIPESLNTPQLQRALTAAQRRAEDMQRRGLTTPSVWDWIKQAGYAGIYGPTTLASSVVGGAQELLLGQPKEAVRALVSGRPGAYGAQVMGQIKAVPEGIGGLLRVLWPTDSAAAAARSGGSQGTANLSERVVNPVGHFVARALERPGEILTEAPDAVFRPLFTSQGMQREAWAMAAERGVRGPQRAAYAEELMREAEALRANPDTPVASEDARRILDAGKEYADQLGYKGDPGRFGRWLGQMAKRDDAIGVMASFLMPFPSMAARMTTSAARSTPLVGLLPAVRRGQSTFDVAYDQAFGTAVAAGVAYWAFNGGVTGSGPSDPEKRKMLIDQGWQPNSTMVGGHYVPNRVFQRFQPMLDAAGEIHDALAYGKKDAKPSELAADLVKRGTKIATDQVGLSGLADLHDMLTQGFASQFPGWAARSGLRYVPYSGVLRAAANALDPNQRRPERWGDEAFPATAIGQNLEMAVPGLRQNVPAAQDTLGRPARNPQQGLGALVPRVTSQQDDPIIRVFQSANVDIGAPRDKITMAGAPIDLTPAEQRRWNEARGAALIQMVGPMAQGGGLDRMPPAVREKMLKGFLDTAAQQADMKVFAEIPAPDRARRLREALTTKAKAS